MTSTNEQRDDANLVRPEDACPKCGERDADLLEWIGDDGAPVECQRCKTVYVPGGGRDGDAAR